MDKKRATHNLEFNVSQILKEGTGATRLYEVEAEQVRGLDSTAVLVSPLIGQVKFLCTGRSVLVTSFLEGTIEKSCGRCLETFTAPITIELEEEFFPSLDIVSGVALAEPTEVDEANQIDEQHILDLHEVVRQEFWLVSDTVLYCRSDCKGLCPHCGKDLNIESCNCKNEVINWRWAGLLEIESKE